MVSDIARARGALLGLAVGDALGTTLEFRRPGSFAPLGDDADTTGAVYGQIAEAYYGESGIRQEWLARLATRERIEGLAIELAALRPDDVEARRESADRA